MNAYGLFDTKDHAWVKNSQGIDLYTEQEFAGRVVPAEMIARGAAAIINRRFGWGPRIVPRPYQQQAEVKK